MVIGKEVFVNGPLRNGSFIKSWNGAVYLCYRSRLVLHLAVYMCGFSGMAVIEGCK